jgi:hypothetical protein
MKIKEAAMIYNNKVYTGKRHDIIISDLIEKGMPWPIIGIQGFITNDGIFVNRHEAYNIAERAEQLLQTRKDRTLFSEYCKYE